MSAAEKCLTEILKLGLDDWVQAAELAWVAASVGRADTPDEIREVSLATLDAGLARGVILVGDIGANGFTAWNMPSAQVLEAVDSSWRSLGHTPGLGELFWVCNTTLGDELGRSLIGCSE